MPNEPMEFMRQQEDGPDKVFNKLDIPEILNVLHIKRKNGLRLLLFSSNIFI